VRRNRNKKGRRKPPIPLPVTMTKGKYETRTEKQTNKQAPFPQRGDIFLSYNNPETTE
jgi:hypothetical protein